ncbi:MAG TPA: nuclear transport factor 2 family protein [Acidimicrobiales bacterium]
MDDVEAIKKVQAQYCRAADTRDWDLLRATVTEDFFCDTGSSGRGATTGVEAFIDRVGTNPTVTVHHALLPEIELTTPSTAHGIWAVHLFAKTPDGTPVDSYGHYHNTYEKTGDAWRLSRLQLEWLHREVGPGPAPSEGEATRRAPSGP